MDFKEYLKISEMLDDLSEECLENIINDKLDEEFMNLNESSSQQLADKNDAQWITSNGVHYCIDKSGTIVSGKFRGTKMSDLKSVSKSKLKTKFNNIKHTVKKGIEKINKVRKALKPTNILKKGIEKSPAGLVAKAFNKSKD